jgi:hypothetical protein
LECVIRKVQENQVGLKLNGTHQLLAHADDVNILADNIGTTNKNTKTLSDASKEGGLEVNAEKTKNMLLSHHQNARCNYNINIDHLEMFKYLGMTVKNQISFSRKLRGDEIWVMLATMSSRAFCLLVCRLKT